MFYYKRRVVLLQTTCCFTQNDVLFLWKWICFCLAAVTLVTAKKQKSCRMRACYARVYVCVARGEDLLGIIDSFCCECVAKMWVGNLETPFFCWFFTLLPHIYPYSIRGRKQDSRLDAKWGCRSRYRQKCWFWKGIAKGKLHFRLCYFAHF